MTRRTAAAAILLASLALPNGWAAPARAEEAQVSATFSVPADEAPAVELILDAMRRVRDSYLEPTTPEELARIAASAMAGRDRWSAYLDPEAYRENRRSSGGRTAGVGIRYRATGDGVLILDVVPGSPAAEAGLAPGDLILAVGGRPVAGLPLGEVRELMRGAPGDELSLRVVSGEDDEVSEVRLARREIEVPSVRASAIGRIGYLRIERFDRLTHPGVRDAMTRLADEIGPGLAGWVIDLRGNPGGLVSASVRIADEFLDEGPILSAVGRARGSTRTHLASEGQLALGLPAAVLVDARSASASEILAGALKDRGRAVLVGDRTFGKGVIQGIYPTADGGAIKITTARYLTPSGSAIHEVGIAPDVPVQAAPAADEDRATARAPDPASDPQLARALEILAAGS
jgi:carboxyl-terminal processing protease